MTKMIETKDSRADIEVTDEMVKAGMYAVALWPNATCEVAAWDLVDLYTAMRHLEQAHSAGVPPANPPGPT